MELDYSKKISIVIPTRNRAEFLGPCIETCLKSEDKNLEIIVSNNNSTDDTELLVRSIKDPRVKLVTPGRDVSMRQNFEYALSQASGEYVIFIGDDDGILSNGLSTVRHLINAKSPDVIIWKHITYLWPHKNNGPKNGLLKFRFRDFCGPLEELNPREILNKYCQTQLTNYRDGANIYHGCISRKLITQIKSKGGQYFQGQIPDVNTAISNLAYANNLIWIRNPVTIAGQGEKSNGAAMNSGGQTDDAQKKIAASFKTLADTDPVQAEIDLKIRTIPAYTYANLLLVNRVHCDNSLNINHSKWREVIIKDMKRFPLEHRRWDLLDSFFCKMDSTYQANPDLVNLDKGVPVENLSVIQKHYKNKGKIKSEHLSSVEATAKWIDQVTWPPYKPYKNKILAYGQQALRMILMILKKAYI